MGVAKDGGRGDGVKAGRVLDPEARRRFEALALPHLASVYRLAVRLTGGAQDAEDLPQETYLKAMRAFPGLNGSAPGSSRS